MTTYGRMAGGPVGTPEELWMVVFMEDVHDIPIVLFRTEEEAHAFVAAKGPNLAPFYLVQRWVIGVIGAVGISEKQSA